MNKHPSLNAITSGTSSGTAAHGTGAFEGGEVMIMGDRYGDFMDLRDPFASPPPTKLKRNPNGYVREGLMNVDSLDDGHGACYEDVFVGSTGGHSRGEFGRRMSAWGKLPVPMKEYSNLAGGMGNRGVGLNHALPSTTISSARVNPARIRSESGHLCTKVTKVDGGIDSESLAIIVMESNTSSGCRCYERYEAMAGICWTPNELIEVIKERL